MEEAFVRQGKAGGTTVGNVLLLLAKRGCSYAQNRTRCYSYKASKTTEAQCRHDKFLIFFTDFDSSLFIEEIEKSALN